MKHKLYTANELKEITDMVNNKSSINENIKKDVSLETLTSFFSLWATKGHTNYIMYPGTIVYKAFLKYEDVLGGLGYKITRVCNDDNVIHYIIISWDE